MYNKEEDMVWMFITIMFFIGVISSVLGAGYLIYKLFTLVF
jgi:hypothetical protein